MMDAPVWRDVDLLQTVVGIEEFAEICKGVTNVVHTDLGSSINIDAVRAKHRHIGDGKAMMLVIISKKSDRSVLVLHPSFENISVPLDHFIVATRHINH